MNTGFSSRGRSVLSGVLALAVTTLLTSSLVGSFDPAQLDQVGAAKDRPTVVEARRDTTLNRWT